MVAGVVVLNGLRERTETEKPNKNRLHDGYTNQAGDTGAESEGGMEEKDARYWEYVVFEAGEEENEHIEVLR